MFEDALFATNRRRHPQQRWAALLSFCIQAALLTFLVAVPLFFTEAGALERVNNWITLPAPPLGRAPQPPEQPAARQQPTNSNLDQFGRIIEVRRIPEHPIQLVDTTPPPRIGTGPGVPGSTGAQGTPGGVLDTIVNDAARANVTPVLKTPKTLKLSHIDEGLLIRKVQPEYPQIAKLAHQQGTVYLHAVIGRDGSIQQLQAIDGPPLLVRAAVDAVRQWRYRPYILNGEPVEVETQIMVVFRLGS